MLPQQINIKYKLYGEIKRIFNNNFSLNNVYYFLYDLQGSVFLE